MRCGRVGRGWRRPSRLHQSMARLPTSSRRLPRGQVSSRSCRASRTRGESLPERGSSPVRTTRSISWRIALTSSETATHRPDVARLFFPTVPPWTLSFKDCELKTLGLINPSRQKARTPGKGRLGDPKPEIRARDKPILVTLNHRHVDRLLRADDLDVRYYSSLRSMVPNDGALIRSRTSLPLKFLTLTVSSE